MTLFRRHRLAKGFTQEQLASKVGVDQSAVSLWETGGAMPSPGFIPKIARVFGIDPLELTRVIEPDAKPVTN